MLRRVGIMFSTNDPDNGNDLGHVTAVTALDRNDTAIDLVFDDYPSRAPSCRVEVEPRPLGPLVPYPHNLGALRLAPSLPHH